MTCSCFSLSFNFLTLLVLSILTSYDNSANICTHLYMYMSNSHSLYSIFTYFWVEFAFTLEFGSSTMTSRNFVLVYAYVEEWQSTYFSFWTCGFNVLFMVPCLLSFIELILFPDFTVVWSICLDMVFSFFCRFQVSNLVSKFTIFGFTWLHRFPYSSVFFIQNVCLGSGLASLLSWRFHVVQALVSSVTRFLDFVWFISFSFNFRLETWIFVISRRFIYRSVVFCFHLLLLPYF